MTAHKSSILQELSWRAMIAQTTHDELDEALFTSSTTLYCGFDPSASSLHVGNLVGIMALAFFQRHGHNPVALVGGATGLIGDPSGKSEERNLLTDDVLEENLAGIGAQLRTILDRAMALHPETVGPGAHPRRADVPPLVNNADWMKTWSYIDFLREVGKHFRVNAMLAKDSVRTRLEEREQGISYTEFSYMLIQAYDFLHLYQQNGCTLQIGGSDQWGNITAGTELIRKKTGAPAFGLTFPLITSATGQKLGKSEQGAVWLDAERTSPYQFYQYWISIDDRDVIKLLRFFTFLGQAEVEVLEAELEAGQNQGQLQRRLALEVTALVHGQDEADKALRASRMLFGERIEGLSDRDLNSVFADVPSTTVARASLADGELLLVDLLVETSLQKSKGEARRLLAQGGAYINNERVDDPNARVTLASLASESMLVLRAGKKNYHVVRIG
ncbi:MAG: tyrosine--tRNA ligase [Bradymonadaceae bacterium]|nr:tyrosine--tRNA ligase [Lujinxingiaceae bacterium]